MKDLLHHMRHLILFVCLLTLLNFLMQGCALGTGPCLGQSDLDPIGQGHYQIPGDVWGNSVCLYWEAPEGTSETPPSQFVPGRCPPSLGEALAVCMAEHSDGSVTWLHVYQAELMASARQSCMAYGGVFYYPREQ